MKDINIKAIVEKHTTDGVTNYEAVNAEVQEQGNNFANNLIKGKVEKSKEKTLTQINNQLGTSYTSLDDIKGLKPNIKSQTKTDDDSNEDNETIQLMKAMQEEIKGLKTNIKAKENKTVLNNSQINDEFRDFADYEAKKLMKSEEGLNYSDALSKVKEKFEYISKAKPNINVGKETKQNQNPDNKSKTKKSGGLKSKFKI